MKDKYFTEKERFQLEILLKKKHSKKEIAETLGKSLSSIYREIKEGTVILYDSHHVKDVAVYCADVGQRKQDERKKNKGAKPKYKDSKFLSHASDFLNKKYSPYAVQKKLSQMGYSVCVKTIYNYIHSGDIPKYKSTDLLMPRKRKSSKKTETRMARNHTMHRSIEDRPEDVLNRNEFGHWELDSVESGKGDKTTLLCFTERMTRIELLYKVSGKTFDNTVKILNRLERKLSSPVFRDLFKSITVDNGCEFSDAVAMEKSYYNKHLPRTTVYHCHPYCSSERGSNENQNKFLRRFIPKGDYIGLYSDREIKDIQSFMNLYPRKMFGGLSAYEFLNQSILSARAETLLNL
jgi:IS30 family transposase